MGINGFALIMGFLLLAAGAWGPRLVARLELTRESTLIQDGRLKLTARRRSLVIRAALILMGLGLGLSGFRLSGTAAAISLIISVALMLVGLIGITVAMLVTIRETRRR
jgi:hypothetical protein